MVVCFCSVIASMSKMVFVGLLLTSYLFFSVKPPDPCKTVGCNAPYNLGCRNVNNTAECICPTCPDIVRPICASDDVQDRSQCHMRRQSCETGDRVTPAKPVACGMKTVLFSL